MKKTFALITLLLIGLGIARAQNVYFAGQSGDTAQVWKDNTLVFSLSDTLSLHLDDMRLANDSTFYLAGHVSDSAFTQGRVWLNDSCVFAGNPNSVVNKLHLGEDSWMASGYSTNATGYINAAVWQNGILTYSPNDSINSFAYALAVNGSDIFYAGCVSVDDTLGIDVATVWQNDTLLWQDGYGGCILDIFHDGTDLYAAGYFVLEGLVSAALWQNDSIIFSAGNLDYDALFSAMDIHNGSIYLAGYIDDSLTVWQDGEVLYSHPFDNTNSEINALVVNEFGVYYAGRINGVATVWKDGEILYQPEGCEVVIALCVLPSPPLPDFTLTVVANDTLMGSVTGSGVYPLGDTAIIEAFANIGCEFLFWNDSITDNPRDIIITQDSTFTAHFGLIDYFVEVKASPENAGTVAGSGIYHYGETIEIEATALEGHDFLQWADGITDNPRSVTITSDTIFTAEFSTYQYEISASATPENGGTVSGIGIYDHGSTATLTAIANEYYEFVCWNDGQASNPRSFIVTQNATFTAMFTKTGTPEFTITVVSDNPALGSVSGGGTFPEDSLIEIEALPVENAHFLRWDDNNTDNPRSIIVTQDQTFTAFFELKSSYNVVVRSENETMGTVYGSGVYLANSTVGIGAIPNEGYHFAGWQDGIMDNPRFVTVTEDCEFMASFAENPIPTYTVTIYFDENQGFAIGSGTYAEGKTATIAAIPNDGYQFTKWSDNTTENPKEIIVDRDIFIAAFFNGLGVEEQPWGFVTLYPNPVEDELRIEGMEGEVKLFNANGVLLKRWLLDGDTTISLAGLPAGVYFIGTGGRFAKLIKK
ncbi:MAG: T9SS type A sorting domain-containing protein [Bacteroidales bacterium]|nr:T9SS type A sorting domain-containing protein [Bacteroidales bacterium]